MSEVEQLSPRWRHAVIVTFALGFCRPPADFHGISERSAGPERVVDTAGGVVFTGSDVRNGQDVFLKYGLMDHVPGDLVFMSAGALPLVLAMTMGYLTLWKRVRGPRQDVGPLTAAARGGGDS